jgi:hypothetical protein
MPHSRHVDPNGILITMLTGVVTLDELIEVQKELVNYVRDEEIYELVIHPDDSEIIQNVNESILSAENVQKILRKIKKGAIAFVSNNDYVYGLCRQLQMRVENDRFQLCVFRTEETALKWLCEIKASNAADADEE